MASRALPLVATLAVSLAAPALAVTPSVVIDVESGRVLHAERATDPWFPASVTKLMTVYVALDMVRQGRVSMNSMLTLSAEAAAEPPSKMGFKPGTQITLENALKIIMVKSANDVARMIGENLGGSVEGFAAAMNETARRIGMRESRWVNSHGLPDERQHTSARDMAILGRALLLDFPERQTLFRIGALKLGSQVIRNHNGLLGRYPGADGMKTGFICAGGFNVVASSTQNGRRLIAVVMGYPSAKERDLRTADLLDQGFATSGWNGQSVESLPPSASMSPPNLRPIVCNPNKRQPEADDETAVVARAPAPASDNPFSSLFAPTTFASATGDNEAILGSRRDLGPRVAFVPEPIWLGPSPGPVRDPADKPAVRPSTAIAAKPVKTKPLARTGPIPAAAQAFAPTPPGARVRDARSVETVKTVTRPGGRAALQDNIKPEPAAATPPAETRARPGAVGSGAAARPKLGAIPARADDAKPQPKPEAKPAPARKAAPKPAATDE